MYSRLIVIAGPMRGEIFALSDSPISIGRERGNAITISDPSMSRRHCHVIKEGIQYKIHDLESSNGTFVNDLPVRERILAHSDRIRTGDTEFLVVLQDPEKPAPESVIFEEDDARTEVTSQLRSEDTLYLQPSQVLEAAQRDERVLRNLHALLKISTIINSIRDQAALQQKLMEMIFEVVPAEQSAILLSSKNGGDFDSIFAWEYKGYRASRMKISRTVLKKVFLEGVSVVINGIEESAAWQDAESLIMSPVKSLLAVPLMLYGQKLGVLYLDRSDPRAGFDQEHLQLMTAIAGVAAVALSNSQHLEWLQDENRRLLEEIGIEHNMIGESARMREVYQFISRAAPTNATVMVRGESGTGKELAARAIHKNSLRRAKPFVVINCAALAETLLESELFGHEKGAFTGALTQKKGKLEFAHGGTAFLDEIGEMAPALQAKLLRVFQEQEFERVGGVRPIKVDIRFISATNRDLEAAVKDGSLRQDLYYRMNVLPVTMPPLRDRREDIPLLASYFVARFCERSRIPMKGISLEARAYLLDYSWPGNVRELQNAIERAVVLGSSDRILPEDLPEALLEGGSSPACAPTKYHETIKQTKIDLIIQAVEQAGGNYTEAARILGVHPNYLHRMIRNLNLKSVLRKQNRE